ncbi:hypothetical protein BKK79_37105 (plasmid) [Cupriavidus sp. USMAA2-4]|uniref:hypothetical protein n=1 Tax=Cupriavidus sp. USMAA2-4 TaxID=876364 RepID=UPI0008A711C6|nr:hypothetical protein [Cupriavidus sp. USMAA2-4]AOY97559.1 hypothetical protein BKK79_37105 [Cupriavidus sp. USMAA2-4]
MNAIEIPAPAILRQSVIPAGMPQRLGNASRIPVEIAEARSDGYPGAHEVAHCAGACGPEN